MAKLAPYVFWQELDDDGSPLSGGKLYTYEAGTSTPKATYTDSSEGTENTNPVILDSAGRADIWLGEGSYKLVLTDSDDVVIKTKDDVAGDTSAAFLGTFSSIATNTTITSAYQNAFIRVTATATLSLLAVSDAGEGFAFVVKADGADATIDPDGSETINGASTLVVENGYSALITCNGTAWYTAFYEYNANLAAIGGLTSAANKVPYFTGSETAGLLDFVDEDDMSSDSATAIPSQQSVKAYVDDSVPTLSDLMPTFTSSNQTITAAGTLTIAHGLGEKPFMVQAFLVCQTGEHNYTAGDEIPVSFNDNSGSSGGLGLSCVPDATNLNVRYGSGSGGNVFIYTDKTSGDTVSLTNANWRLQLRAFAI